MNNQHELIRQIRLSDTPKGVISISHIKEPYGEGSHNVVSVGISLTGDVSNPKWKTHIPYENLQDVLEGLKEAQSKFGKG